MLLLEKLLRQRVLQEWILYTNNALNTLTNSQARSCMPLDSFIFRHDVDWILVSTCLWRTKNLVEVELLPITI
ncbi:hypothetical protein ACOSQ3_024767 [Xanthoceras sorbifolium]